MSEIVVDIEPIQDPSQPQENGGETEESTYRGRKVCAVNHGDESNLSATGGCSGAIKGFAFGAVIGAPLGAGVSIVFWIPGIVWSNDVGKALIYTAIGLTALSSVTWGVAGLQNGYERDMFNH
ncbi:MAG: hypothetical protein AAGG81_00760 [Chlamydiota bacterium]